MEDVIRKITKQEIIKARAENSWDFSNQILYGMCKRHRSHSKPKVVIGKLLIIGRVYSAALERRNPKKGKRVPKGGDFYLDIIVPEIKKAKLDKYFRNLTRLGKPDLTNAHFFISAHHRLVTLFKHTSGQDKRSLASKYLHFHYPQQFFIFDSRAKKALSKHKFKHKSAMNSVKTKLGDRPYDKDYLSLFVRCILLRDFIRDQHNTYLSPRELDKFLLGLDR